MELRGRVPGGPAAGAVAHLKQRANVQGNRRPDASNQERGRRKQGAAASAQGARGNRDDRRCGRAARSERALQCVRRAPGVADSMCDDLRRERRWRVPPAAPQGLL